MRIQKQRSSLMAGFQRYQIILAPPPPLSNLTRQDWLMYNKKKTIYNVLNLPTANIDKRDENMQTFIG